MSSPCTSPADVADTASSAGVSTVIDTTRPDGAARPPAPVPQASVAAPAPKPQLPLASPGKRRWMMHDDLRPVPGLAPVGCTSAAAAPLRCGRSPTSTARPRRGVAQLDFASDRCRRVAADGLRPPPRTCFQMLPSPEVLGINAQHSSRPSGFCSMGLFRSNQFPLDRVCSHHYYRQSMGHPLPPRRPGGIQPYTPAVATVKRCPFRHLSLPPVALAALAPEATRSLTRRPARAIYRSRPRRHSRPTHASPRLRLSFDSGPPAQLTGTGLHTPWAWDRLGPTSAHDCGCPSIPGLRPS